MNRLGLVLLSTVALTPVAGPAFAQTKAAPKPAAVTPPTGAPTDASNVKIERGAGGKKVYRITTAITIEGKIQKPEAFYVLQKSAINYEWQELKQEFIPKILDSVSKAPF